MTTVTEIDRVAAANAISEHEGGWSRHCQQIVVGNADWDHVVQALAAHRIAAEIEGARKMREAAVDTCLSCTHEVLNDRGAAAMEILNLDPATVIKGEEV